MKNNSNNINGNNDLVSIVIPVYNSEMFLTRSIESALNQTYQNIEILVIDDGSTDKSSEILKQYSDDIIIISQSNQGLAKAVNNSIKMMRGKWLKWLSPDDVLYSNAVEILVSEAKKLPENTIVYSDWELINKNDKKLRSFYESNYNNLEIFDFNVRLLTGQQININTTLIPHSLFHKGCLFEDLKDPVSVDYDFFLRAGILFNYKFYLITKSLLQYRIHSGQLSHTSISKSLQCLNEVRSQVLSQLDEKTKEKYLLALKKYDQTRPISTKFMIWGLRLLTSFSYKISDHVLLFYLNNIRNSRR